MIEPFLEQADVDWEALDPKWILEAALGEAPLQRHLSALETNASTVATGPGLLPLLAAHRGLASATTGAAVTASPRTSATSMSFFVTLESSCAE